MLCLSGWTKSDSRASAICVGSGLGIGFMVAFAAPILLMDFISLKDIIIGTWKRLKKAWKKMKTSLQKTSKDEDVTDVVAMNDLCKELA